LNCVHRIMELSLGRSMLKSNNTCSVWESVNFNRL
jgi:hypothetical protein